MILFSLPFCLSASDFCFSATSLRILVSGFLTRTRLAGKGCEEGQERGEAAGWNAGWQAGWRGERGSRATVQRGVTVAVSVEEGAAGETPSGLEMSRWRQPRNWPM